MGKLTLWGMIDAQPVYFPAAVDDMDASTLVFSVPAESARDLVGEAFEVAEAAPGVAHLMISAFELRRADWGPATTFDIGVLVRPVGMPDAATGLYISPGPMAPGFSREATHRALGFVKTKGEITVAYSEREARFRLDVDGAMAVEVCLPRVEPLVPPAPVDLIAYTHIDGQAQAAVFTLMLPVTIIEPEAVGVEVGTGPLADTLRSLGLPRPPEFTVWGEHVSGVFQRPEPVAAPGSGPAAEADAPAGDDPGHDPGAGAG